MKRIFVVFLSILIWVWFAVVPFTLTVDAKWNDKWMNDPIANLDATRKAANWNLTWVQDTPTMNAITSTTSAYYNEWFTIRATFEYLVKNIHVYLQYLEYAGLTAALILVIWNGFMLVMSKDRAGQMKKFTKNLIYIWIWVFLLGWFYLLIELFTSLVNLLSAD